MITINASDGGHRDNDEMVVEVTIDSAMVVVQGHSASGCNGRPTIAVVPTVMVGQWR